MDKLKLLERIEKLYKNQNINIIQYLKTFDEKNELNSVEDIMISYDFQAGTYVKGYNENRKQSDNYVNPLADVIGLLACKKEKIFEAGVGEATTLVPLLNKLDIDFSWIGGLDISYSRIKVAQNFAKTNLKLKNKDINLFVGDMFNIPLQDNSMDIVYTSHALEPNGGHETELLKELYRITNEYLVLLEPAYELANDESRNRMKQHGYVTELYNTAQKLGLDIVSYELYKEQRNPLNPTGMIIIKKNTQGENIDLPFCCPITQKTLKRIGNCWWGGGWPIQ